MAERKKLQYCKVIEEKGLPKYWARKYKLTYQRLRKFHNISFRSKHNPMFEICLERIAMVSTKMLYYESPDFHTNTGYKIENPMYMEHQNRLLKEFTNLLKEFKDLKPDIEAKKAESENPGVKDLDDADLDREIAALISGAEEKTKPTAKRERVKKGKA